MFLRRSLTLMRVLLVILVCVWGWLNSGKFQKMSDTVDLPYEIEIQKQYGQSEKKKKFQCNICNKISIQRRSMKVHAKIVYSIMKRFECDSCIKRFGITSRKDVHKKVKGFECNSCEFCENNFHKKLVLVMHVNLIHESMTPFQCKVCD